MLSHLRGREAVADRGGQRDLHSGALLNAVRERANCWLPGPTKPDVRLLSVTVRGGSVLHRIHVDAKDTSGLQLLVKVPLTPLADALAVQDSSIRRPHLLPSSGPLDKPRYQYAALSAAHAYFQRLEDSRLRVNRAVDFLPEHGAVVVQHVTEQTLAEVLRTALPGRPRSTSVAAAFHNAGAWLRTFHEAGEEVASGPPLGTLRGTPEELVDALGARVDYIVRQGGAHHGQPARAFEAVRDAVSRGALASLPQARYHGDFAPRNIFSSHAGDVTVFDVHGQWVTPIYEDVAFFLVAMRTTRAQVVTQDFASRMRGLDHLEEQFLIGYFGERPVPTMDLAPYRLLGLLDRWAGLVWHWTYRSQQGTPAPRQQLRWLCGRYFSRAIDALRDHLGGGSGRLA